VSWQPICLGVRSGWNVSGTEGTQPGMPSGTSYTGITEPGDKQYWVPAKSLYRLNVDLSGWRGSVILLRFRVVTNSTLPNHYASNTVGFGGLYIDDLKVFGETIIHGAQQTQKIEALQTHAPEQPISSTPSTQAIQQNTENAAAIVHSQKGLSAPGFTGYALPSILFIASTIFAAPCRSTSQQGRPKSFS
ncbi:MAG: hypothetical protein ACP5JR_05025, partial [Thermoplasmata archaeon]